MTDDYISVIDWSGAKLMPLEEFVRLAPPAIRASLIDMMTDPAYMVDGIVCFLNEKGSDPEWGARHFVFFGPGRDNIAATAGELIGTSYKGCDAIAYCEKGSPDNDQNGA